MRKASLQCLAGLLLVSMAALADEAPLRIGSKRFTESYVLGEILVQSARAAGVKADHLPGMGNTAILQQALAAGSIDAYPEYTGTIAREILRVEEPLDLAALNTRLAAMGFAASVPLGFSNGYALGMGAEAATRHGIRSLSDLAQRPQLRYGLSHEFIGRRDGWPGLQAAYQLAAISPRGLDHGLAYEALAAGEIDVIDLYTTDAKIVRNGIAVLADDRKYFPRYDAVILHRVDTPSRHPRAWAALASLAGRIDEATMIRLNARAEIDRVDFAAVAREYLGGGKSASRNLLQAVFAPDFGRLLAGHVGLVFGSLALAVLCGIPLGIAAARHRRLAQPVLLTAGLLQTIPSLAMLAFLIPITGSIGAWPAIIALFLYALLPIVRNTHAGILGVRDSMRQAALALGLGKGDVLTRVELPLAAPTILAGVKTAAVINVGTATIAAFIGAGGFGERIAQGLALNDHTVLLAGALPAAGLALVVHVVFEVLENRVGSRGAHGRRPG